MLKIYGSMLCKDCVQCCRNLDRAGTAYEFRDFADSIVWLKEFLAIRDSNALFASVREAGSIGIPCIVTESGQITLSWDAFL